MLGVHVRKTVHCVVSRLAAFTVIFESAVSRLGILLGCAGECSSKTRDSQGSAQAGPALWTLEASGRVPGGVRGGVPGVVSEGVPAGVPRGV